MHNLNPSYFPSPGALRAWFIANHAQEKELIVGYYKVGSKIPSITWPQSVDEALCFGWIDSVRNSIDSQRYCIRFTPRKRGSFWSAVNLKRIVELDTQGLLTEAGRKVWMERDPSKEYGYSSEQESIGFSPEYESQFQAHPSAWAQWSSMAPSYRRLATFWVMQAKQEATQLRRLATLIDCSAQNQKVPPFKSKGES